MLADFRCQDLLDNDSLAYVGDAGLGKPAAVRDAAPRGGRDPRAGIGAVGEITTDGYALLAAPAPRQALIHVHADAGELNKVYAATLPVIADPDATARALAETAVPGAAGRAGRLARLRAAHLAFLEAPPQPGDLDMGAVMAHLQATPARRRDPDQRRRQLRDLAQQALPLPRPPAADRAAVGSDGLRRAGGDRGQARGAGALRGRLRRRRRLPDDLQRARDRDAGAGLPDRAGGQQPQLRHDPHASGEDLSGPRQLHRARQPRLPGARPRLRVSRRDA